MQFVRTLREGQIRVSERVHGAQGRSAEPRLVLRSVRRSRSETDGAALTEFAKTLLAALPGGTVDQLAINGKVLKGMILDASSKSPLHLVQAFEPRSVSEYS